MGLENANEKVETVKLFSLKRTGEKKKRPRELFLPLNPAGNIALMGR